MKRAQTWLKRHSPLALHHRQAKKKPANFSSRDAKIFGWSRERTFFPGERIKFNRSAAMAKQKGGASSFIRRATQSRERKREIAARQIVSLLFIDSGGCEFTRARGLGIQRQRSNTLTRCTHTHTPGDARFLQEMRSASARSLIMPHVFFQRHRYPASFLAAANFFGC